MRTECIVILKNIFDFSIERKTAKNLNEVAIHLLLKI